MNLGTIIAYFSVDSQSPTRIMLIYPNTVVMHIMATKVYRNLRLGRPGLLVVSPGSTWRHSRSGSIGHGATPFSHLQFTGSGQCDACGRSRDGTRCRASRETFDANTTDFEMGLELKRLDTDVSSSNTMVHSDQLVGIAQ